MGIRTALTLILAILIVALIIIGFFNFNLMLEIWVKVLIGVLFVGLIFAAVKRFIR